MNLIHPDLSAFGRAAFSLGQTEEPPGIPPEQILAPDPVLMAEEARRTHIIQIIKYAGLGLLGGISGWALAGKLDKSQPTGAAIGGVAIPGIVFFFELLLTGIKLSKELPPITME
jgi:hypothetical protein